MALRVVVGSLLEPPCSSHSQPRARAVRPLFGAHAQMHMLLALLHCAPAFVGAMISDRTHYFWVS